MVLRVAVLFGIAVAAFAIYAITEPVALFGYDAKALKRSLADEAPEEYGAARCEQDGRVWQCLIETGSSSGFGAAYELRVDDEGCWTAKPVRYGKPPIDSSQPDLAACVDLMDIIV